MARKKPEAVEALERLTSSATCQTCADGEAKINLHGVDVCLPCYEHAFSTGLAETLRAANLHQRRGEAWEDWRAGVRAWLDENRALFRLGIDQ